MNKATGKNDAAMQRRSNATMRRRGDAVTQRCGDAATDAARSSVAASLRHCGVVWFMLLTFCLPAAAQRPAARRPANVAPPAAQSTELNPAAKAALDAAVAALNANSLTDAERAARAAVQEAPR